MNDNDNDALPNLVKATEDMVKAGKFKEILKVFGEHYADDHPEFIVIKRTVADAMRSRGNINDAYGLYTHVYNMISSSSKLGLEHTDVLSLLIDRSTTTLGLSNMISLLADAETIATRTDNTVILEKIKETRKAMMEGFSPTTIKLYNKLLTKSLKPKSPEKVISKGGHLTVNELDDIMSEFGLDEQETDTNNKKRN
jgi:hypothetical protein